MLSIQVRDVRPLVEVNQLTIRLPQMGDSLSLLWRWRSGGCLGPEAAAAMNARQRQAQGGQASSTAPAGPWSHRRLASGSGLPGLLQNPAEDCSPTLERKDPPGCSALGMPPLSPGDLRQQQPAREQQRPQTSQLPLPKAHGGRHADPKGFHGRGPGGAPFPTACSGLEATPEPPFTGRGGRPSASLPGPRDPQHAAWWEAIHRLAIQVGPEPRPRKWLVVRRAQELIKENSWATRQSSWHRRGWPRPGPEAPIR